MYLSLVLASLLAPQTVASLQETVASSAELNAFAKRVRAFVPRDQFDEAPLQPSMTGRSFSLVVQPRGSDSIPAACFGYPMWSYETGSRTLHVSTGAHDFVVGSFSSRQGMITRKPTREGSVEKIQYFATDCERADLQAYTSSNAYGAEFRIEPTLQTITAVADALPRGVEWPTSFKIQISGEQARTLVPHLRVRFVGVMSDWKPGVSVACLNRRNGPTARSPYDRRFDICLFNGRIDRIELLDSRTGKAIEAFLHPL